MAATRAPVGSVQLVLPPSLQKGHAHLANHFQTEERKFPWVGLVVTGLATLAATSDTIGSFDIVKKHPWIPAAAVAAAGLYFIRKGIRENKPQYRSMGYLMMGAAAFSLVVYLKKAAAEEDAKKTAQPQPAKPQTAGPEWLELPSGEFIRASDAGDVIDPRTYDAAVKHAAAFYPGR